MYIIFLIQHDDKLRGKYFMESQQVIGLVSLKCEGPVEFLKLSVKKECICLFQKVKLLLNNVAQK